MDTVTRCVAIDEAGNQYEVYIKSMEESIIAASAGNNPIEALEAIKVRLQNLLAIAENKLYRLQHPNR